MTKKIIALVVALVVGFGIGYFVFHQSSQSNLGASPVGSTFGDAKIAGVNMVPSTSAASSTSLLNGDANGRWIKSGEVVCTSVATAGTSVAALTVQAATTSVANEGLQGNTNLALNIVVATSSPFSQNASTTVASTVSLGSDLYYWASGTYITLLFNSTDTGACTVVVSYQGT